MREPTPPMTALSRAGRRAAYHLLQAAVESLKALEAVIEELGAIGEDNNEDEHKPTTQRIEVE